MVCVTTVSAEAALFSQARGPCSFTTPGGNYAPAVIGNLSASYVEQHLISGRPFFTYIAPHSPHGPATPAPWYTDRFPNVSAPRTPTYNVSAPDHHWAVASQPPVDAALEASMDDLARNRLRTLLTVDDTLRELHELIGRYGQLNNTVGERECGKAMVVCNAFYRACVRGGASSAPHVSPYCVML